MWGEGACSKWQRALLVGASRAGEQPGVSGRWPSAPLHPPCSSGLLSHLAEHGCCICSWRAVWVAASQDEVSQRFSLLGPDPTY